MRFRSALLVSLALALVGPPVTAQETAAEGTGLQAVCEANSPDEVTKATCLEIVATVLDPEGETAAGATEPTPLAEFLYGTEDRLSPFALDAGSWVAVNEKGKTAKVGSKAWKAIAASQADDLGAYVLTVVPGPCNEGQLLDVWSLYGALRQAGAGAKGGDRLIQGALTELITGIFDFAPECGPGWEP